MILCSVCRSQANRKCIRKLPKWQAASAPQSRHLDSPPIKDMIVKELKTVELATDEDIHATKTIAEDSRLLTASQSNESYLLTGSSSMGKLPEMVQVTTCSLNHSHVPKDLLGENFNIVEMPTKHCGTKEEAAMSSSDAPRNDVGQPYSTANLTCGLTRLLTTIDDPNLRCQIDGDVLSVNECRSSLFAWPELDSLILQVINDWLDRSNMCPTTGL
ncbi:unnamed protein product [Sphagnum jensenii]|uniref:Uncharacterized protein n=1 Tax=Sphagnum jensenii TaxID=128206 RepID=A0ABP1ABJ1_9BRYO